MKNYLKTSRATSPADFFFFDDESQTAFTAALTLARARNTGRVVAVWRRYAWMPADVRCVGHAERLTDITTNGHGWACDNCGQQGRTERTNGTLS